MWNERVTFTQILDAKEARRQAIQGLLSRFCVPVISVTTVSVGEIKLTPDACLVGEKASDYITETFGEQILYSAFYYRATGYEAFFAVQGEAREIKRICIDYEENYPLGRLADIDVTNLAQEQISRTDLGFCQRKCLICSNSARQCYVSKTHSADQVAERIAQMIAQYKSAGEKNVR